MAPTRTPSGTLRVTALEGYLNTPTLGSAALQGAGSLAVDMHTSFSKLEEQRIQQQLRAGTQDVGVDADAGRDTCALVDFVNTVTSRSAGAVMPVAQQWAQEDAARAHRSSRCSLSSSPVPGAPRASLPSSPAPAATGSPAAALPGPNHLLLTGPNTDLGTNGGASSEHEGTPSAPLHGRSMSPRLPEDAPSGHLPRGSSSTTSLAGSPTSAAPNSVNALLGRSSSDTGAVGTPLSTSGVLGCGGDGGGPQLTAMAGRQSPPCVGREPGLRAVLHPLSRFGMRVQSDGGQAGAAAAPAGAGSEGCAAAGPAPSPAPGLLADKFKGLGLSKDAVNSMMKRLNQSNSCLPASMTRSICAPGITTAQLSRPQAPDETTLPSKMSSTGGATRRHVVEASDVIMPSASAPAQRSLSQELPAGDALSIPAARLPSCPAAARSVLAAVQLQTAAPQLPSITAHLEGRGSCGGGPGKQGGEATPPPSREAGQPAAGPSSHNAGKWAL